MTNGRLEMPSFAEGLSALASVLPIRSHDEPAVKAAREAHFWTLLDLLPRAVFLIAPDGTLTAMNAAAGTLLRTCTFMKVTSDRRLHVLDSRANSAMQQAVKAAGEGRGHEVLSIQCRQNDTNTLDLAVMSLGDEGVALVVSDRAALTTASPVALRKLYGLTPAEQRVVSALVAGASVRDAAEQMGITLNTIRRHLKQIFAKMGVARQSDLVRLVTCGPAMLWFDAVPGAKPCDFRPPRRAAVTSS